MCNDFGNNVPYSAYLEAFSQNAGMRPRALSEIDTSIQLGGLRQQHYTHSGTPPGSISSFGVSDKSKSLLKQGVSPDRLRQLDGAENDRDRRSSAATPGRRERGAGSVMLYTRPTNART